MRDSSIYTHKRSKCYNIRCNFPPKCHLKTHDKKRRALWASLVYRAAEVCVSSIESPYYYVLYVMRLVCAVPLLTNRFHCFSLVFALILYLYMSMGLLYSTGLGICSVLLPKQILQKAEPPLESHGFFVQNICLILGIQQNPYYLVRRNGGVNLLILRKNDASHQGDISSLLLED